MAGRDQATPRQTPASLHNNLPVYLLPHRLQPTQPELEEKAIQLVAASSKMAIGERERFVPNKLNGSAPEQHIKGLNRSIKDNPILKR